MDFTLSNLCRSPNFYVDPTSTKIIETGSHLHPYRTLKPVFAELLNHHAHSDKNFIIYLKESTEVYLEEDANYILNITRVEIRSYSDNLTNTTKRARIVVTNVDQQGISIKAAFHIMKSTDLRLNQKLSEGTLTESELNSIAHPSVGLRVIRSSIALINVNIVSDLSIQNPGLFVNLIYLQHHEFKLENITLNMTHAIADSIDPLNVNIQNVYLDSWATPVGMIFN